MLLKYNVGKHMSKEVESIWELLHKIFKLYLVKQLKDITQSVKIKF